MNEQTDNSNQVQKSQEQEKTESGPEPENLNGEVNDNDKDFLIESEKLTNDLLSDPSLISTYNNSQLSMVMKYIKDSLPKLFLSSSYVCARSLMKLREEIINESKKRNNDQNKIDKQKLLSNPRLVAFDEETQRVKQKIAERHEKINAKFESVWSNRMSESDQNVKSENEFNKTKAKFFERQSAEIITYLNSRKRERKLILSSILPPKKTFINKNYSYQSSNYLTFQKKRALSDLSSEKLPKLNE